MTYRRYKFQKLTQHPPIPATVTNISWSISPPALKSLTCSWCIDWGTSENWVGTRSQLFHPQVADSGYALNPQFRPFHSTTRWSSCSSIFIPLDALKFYVCCLSDNSWRPSSSLRWNNKWTNTFCRSSASSKRNPTFVLERTRNCSEWRSYRPAVHQSPCRSCTRPAADADRQVDKFFVLSVLGVQGSGKIRLCWTPCSAPISAPVSAGALKASTYRNEFKKVYFCTFA